MPDDLDLACKSGSLVDKYCSPDSPIMVAGRSFLRLIFGFFRSKPAAPPSRFPSFSFPSFSSGRDDSHCFTLALASSIIIFVLLSYIVRNKRGPAPTQPAQKTSVTEGTATDGAEQRLQNALNMLNEIKQYAEKLQRRLDELMKSKVEQLEADTELTEGQLKKLQNMKDKNLANSRELSAALENLSRELANQDADFNKDFQMKRELGQIEGSTNATNDRVLNAKNNLANVKSPEAEQNGIALAREVDRFYQQQMQRLRNIEKRIADSENKQAQQRASEALKALRDILDRVQEMANAAGDADGGGESVLSDESKSRMKEIETKNESLKSQTAAWKQLYLDALKHCKDNHVSNKVPKRKCGRKRQLPSPDPFKPDKEKYQGIDIPDANDEGYYDFENEGGEGEANAGGAQKDKSGKESKKAPKEPKGEKQKAGLRQKPGTEPERGSKETSRTESKGASQQEPPEPEPKGGSRQKPPEPELKGGSRQKPPEPEPKGGSRQKPPEPEPKGGSRQKPPEPEPKGGSRGKPPEPEYKGSSRQKPGPESASGSEVEHNLEEAHSFAEREGSEVEARERPAASGTPRKPSGAPQSVVRSKPSTANPPPGGARPQPVEEPERGPRDQPKKSRSPRKPSGAPQSVVKSKPSTAKPRPSGARSQTVDEEATASTAGSKPSGSGSQPNDSASQLSASLSKASRTTGASSLSGGRVRVETEVKQPDDTTDTDTKSTGK